MKIAIYSDNFYPEMSGISDSIITIARGLAEKGHLINFYVPRYSKKNFRISKLKPKEINLGKNIEIFRLPSLPYPPAPTKQGRIALPVLASYKHIKKFNPDIIYTQDFFPAGIEALMISRLLKKPLVGTNHTPVREFLKYAPVHSKLLERIALKYVSWYYNKCIFVSAPANAILNEMRKFGFRGKGRSVSNPIDIQSFKPAGVDTKKALKKKFNLSARTVLYTGRLAEEKKVDVIIRAISLAREKMPDITFAVTGHGNAEANLKKLTKTLGLTKNIFFFGYVEKDVFSDLYRAADIFAVMSTAETQCISMMQAMATGLPVIGANAWGLPEYINSNNGYVVEPGDYKALAQKIVGLFESPQTRAELGQGGLEYVENFSIKNITEAWEKLFKSIIKG